ncbi:hypothetical protein NPIL_207791 [Nephila pilipes]|uniref:Uncharacterized protein n=1 Tax=Nephila pilipes TaxID=299642 RepID=A0A8X6QNH9_NEPPI|nr:hypothetical protein NPIL_207791 [Nephila pilipes]
MMLEAQLSLEYFNPLVPLNESQRKSNPKSAIHQLQVGQLRSFRSIWQVLKRQRMGFGENQAPPSTTSLVSWSVQVSQASGIGAAEKPLERSLAKQTSHQFNEKSCNSVSPLGSFSSRLLLFVT